METSPQPKPPEIRDAWISKFLAHLATDRGEQHNVEAEHPEVVRQLTALLEKYVADGRSTPGAKQSNAVPIKLVKGTK